VEHLDEEVEQHGRLDGLAGAGSDAEFGGGAGMAYSHSRLNDNPVSTNTYLQGSDWRFAWQALAGVKFDVAPGARLTAQYRYLRADGGRSRCATSGTPTATCLSGNNQSQSVDVGLELDL
jgi:opacity protein-like surface antigen